MKYGWLIKFYFTIIFKDIKSLELGSINIVESPIRSHVDKELFY